MLQDPRVADREAARRWARNLVARRDWVVLDTETTGLDRSAQVVQISIIGPDGGVLLDTLVRPIGRIPSRATAIHGITDATVADAPTFRAVYPCLQDILSGKTTVCYNAAFDRRILEQSAIQNETPYLRASWECAMEHYARYVGQWSPSRGHYAWQPLPRRPELRFAKHQALVDCQATLDLIRGMAGYPPAL